MVLGTAAMAIGGHLMKRAYKWARNNPQAVGRGINTLSKMVSAKHQGIGKFITGAAKVAKAMSSKDSYVNKLASAITSDKPSSSSSTESSSPVKKRVYGGGYQGSL